MSESKQRERPAEAAEERGPGPARLFALLAGAFLAMLGVLGFFYDASFGTGDALASDDLAGLLNINGWRNVIYLATGMIALAFASRFPRPTALGLGLFYLAFAIWGFDQTERDIGSILDAVPLGDKDNGLHLAIGILGLFAALIDGPLPAIPKRLRPRKPKSLKAPKLNLSLPKRKGRDKDGLEDKSATDERGSRRQAPAGPRPGDAA